jgi:hypothetical protein
MGASSPDVIEPAEYACWRENYLGARTERIEAAAIFHLSGDLQGKGLLGVNEEFVTLTKQKTVGLCEQVRVN